MGNLNQHTTMTTNYDNADIAILASMLAAIGCDLDNDSTVVKATTGRDGGMVAYSPNGKVIILRGVSRQGYAVVQIHDEKERCYVASRASGVRIPMTDSTWAELCPMELEGYDSVEALVLAAHSTVTDFKMTRLVQREKRQQEQLEAKQREEEKLAKAFELGGESGTLLAVGLKSHDWYYSYSDDGAVWRAGSRRHDQLLEMRANTPNGDSIWALYAPSGY